MAFRGLTSGGKMVVLGMGAAGVAGLLNFYHIPYYTDMYKIFWKVNEIPRFKREMVTQEWNKFQEIGSEHNLLKIHLTKRIMESLKNYKTQRHSNLLLVMQEGIKYPQGRVGANAPDVDAYDLFRPLFDPIINDLHPGFEPGSKHPWKSDWGDEKSWTYFENTLQNLGDNDKRFVKNIRLECCRSLKYFTFQPLMTDSDYFQFEYWISRFFNETPGYGSKANNPNSKLAGKLYEFRKLKDSAKKELEQLGHFSFKNDNKRLEAKGVYQSWPIARALYVNDAKNFAVQINNEEHFKFISLADQNNFDLKSALKRLAEGVKIIENVAPFTKHDRLGYANSSPQNLGTGLNVYFDLNLPNLAKKKDFKEICKNLRLRVDKKDQNTVTVTNISQLGSNEYDTVKSVYDGVKKLIEMEKSA